MAKRIWTLAELDAFVGKTVSVDSLDGFFPNVLLIAVYNSGKFEIITKNSKHLVLSLDKVKVMA